MNTFKLKHIAFIVFVFSLVGTIASAQKSQFTVSGQGVDAASGQGVDYATVVLLNNNDEMIEGASTENGGRFTMTSPVMNVKLEVSFIGYEAVLIDDIQFTERKADLGVIQLGADAKQLDEVIVRADKSTTEFKLDKRVFNVGQDLSSTGASALEVLNNVPSVNVNIEGEVSLRGSTGVQILIDGKPSVLADDSSNALGSITAEMIEKVEVITNPSAKYEAEGTAGIINIVLQKNEKEGINGSVSLNAGIPHNHSVGLSVNRRSKKVNLFSQFGAGYRELPRDNERSIFDESDQTILSSEGVEYRNENFYNFNLGADYYFNPLSVLTLSGNIAYELEDQPSETSFYILDIAESNRVDEWKRVEDTGADNLKYQYDL